MKHSRRSISVNPSQSHVHHPLNNVPELGVARGRQLASYLQRDRDAFSPQGFLFPSADWSASLLVRLIALYSDFILPTRLLEYTLELAT